MYIPKYFEIQELVPPDIFNGTREDKRANLWFLFDERLLITADRLRERYGTLICNTWAWAHLSERFGRRQFSGWRPGDCEVGSQLSQHKRGAALDLLPQKAKVDDIRYDILADPWSDDFKFITCIELNVSWLHVDTRNWDKEEHGIFTVKP